MQSKMPDGCAAAGCKQSASQPGISFFRFPLDPERCIKWAGNCGRPDLQTKSPEYLHRNFKLCSRHFEESLILKESQLKRVLKDDAVPTIFHGTQTSGRKRSRQPAAEDPVNAKKTKDDPQATAAQQSVTEVSGENSVTPIPQLDEPENEDPSTSKAKETLKLYFKETLALTGFSIGSNAALGATTSMGPQNQLNPICLEQIKSNEVLKLGEDVMREEIRNSLRLARFFSILLQDQITIEGKDQIAVFIRTVSNDGFPQKHLLGFLPCDVDADRLFLTLVTEIRSKWGLRMEHCRGFTYLTTGALSQKLKELSCRILRDFPQVVLAPSDPYAFNMWLIRSMPVLSIQDVVETVEEVAAVLRQSSTLMKKLHIKITAAYGHIKGEVDRVKEACQNNWEYGTDAFQTMLEILEPLLSSIGEMCTSALSEVDTAIVEQLLKLKEKLKNFNFIISLVVLKNTLCCVSILNPSLRGIISISSTLQYTISNALKLLNKHLQEIPIFHRKWFSDAVGRAKKLGVTVTLPMDTATNGDTEEKPQPSPEDYYRESLSKMILQYLIDEVKRVLGIEMVRILRWLSLVPSYMADHNFSIRKDKVADANLNNLARPDSFYDELGCWEVKWRHASKRRILPTSVFATLKIPDIGFYPNVQSLLRVLGSIPCINADADVYGQYDMVLERYRSYMREVPAEQRLCNMAFVYVNQDVHVNIEEMVQSYAESHPDTLQLLCKDDMMEVQPSAPEGNANDISKEDLEEPKEMTLNMELERPKATDGTSTDTEALKSALQAAVAAACGSQSRQSQGGQEGEVEYVTKSEMKEVLKVCEDVVRERILSEVGTSFFSLFIDRAVRFGDAESLPLFLRFVDSFDVMRLELMGFVDASLDSESMCERLFDIVTKEWGLDLKYCRGQAYLGSGEVSYKLKAFACKVQETHPLAICTHCSCYSFNTWWSRSVPVASVSRAIDTLEKVVLFFSSMADLEKELDQVLAVGLRESYEKVHELQGTFCASWLEKHDSYDVFAQILEPLAQCLESFQSSDPQRWSLSVINQAKKLLHLIRDFDFIVAIVALKNVSSFTRELSMALQKDHFSAASQLCQISGIVATLNRVKTNIKVFHQNWFEEACTFAQSLGVQVKVPDSLTVTRDSHLKPGGYYKDAVSLPLVDHLINSVKDHFSDDHKEALNFLSLVPCSVPMSYTFESLNSKPPLYVGDLPDPNNFLTELSCWKVKWKTKVVSPTIPDTIFQTLRLPLMQYFSNINTLLKIMCVLPSTALEYCGDVKHHKMFQDYLKNTFAKDRSPCLAMLQVGVNFNQDLDRMVAQCLKVTPKTLEGICLDKESKTLQRNSEVKEDVENHRTAEEEMEIVEVFSKDKTFDVFPPRKEVYAEVNNHKDAEEMDTQPPPPEAVLEEQQTKPLDENGHFADNLQSSERVFRVAARMSRRNCLMSELPKEEQDCIIQELSTCHWDQGNTKFLSDEEILEHIMKSVRTAIVSEVQESPFFSIITDKLVSVDEKKYVPIFVRYVDDCTPKVELLGFLPVGGSDADLEAKTLSDILTEEWGLQMGYCRGQSFMCMGAGSQSLRKMSIDFVANYPLAVNTPSESCGLAYWLAVSLQNEPITKVLGVVEDLLLFFDQSPRLHVELSETMEGLLNTPREALAEVPETCLSRWKKMEDFFDILVDMLEGVLSCLDSVSNNANGTWSNSASIHALILSTALRESDFVIPLVILKNVCAPLRNCSTVFRCGNPADIICELEKIPLIMETLNKMLENISAVHAAWFEEAVQLAAKVSGGVSYPETAGGYESPEVGYREMVSRPVLRGLIEEMKFNFDECHLKALKVLSLLPTCNPLPILPEAADKLYTIYRSDLPEPETAEEDINTWATAWREKYQDVSPPASISETLHHPEAKSLPNVTALLKLVAVLPSISMEWDLMKTTLNSMRTFLKNDIICRGCKTDTVMLLMHGQMLQALEEVMDTCMDNDPESRGFLSQMKQNVSSMRMDGEVLRAHLEEITIATNGSGGSEEKKGPAPAIAEDQPDKAQCDVRELGPPPPDGTETVEDGTMETDTYSNIQRIQECPPHSIDAQLMTVVPDGTEGSATASEDQLTTLIITTDSATVEKVITMDLAAVQGVTAEALTEALAQGEATEVPTVVPAQDVSTEPIESIQETVQNDAPELATELGAQDVTAGLVAASDVLTLELRAEPQVNMAESIPTLDISVDSGTPAQIIPTEPVAEAAVVMLQLSAMQGISTESVMEAAVQQSHPDTAAEEGAMQLTEAVHGTAMDAAAGTPAAAELAVHGVTLELNTDVSMKLSAPEGLSPEPVTVAVVQSVEHPVDTAQDETSEPDTAAQGVTLEIPAAQGIVPEMAVLEAADEHGPDSAAQVITPESAKELTVQEFPTEAHAVSDDVPMELTEVEQAASAGPGTGPEKAEEDVLMELTDKADVASTEAAAELAAQHATAEPVTSSQDVSMELPAAAQITPTEPCTQLDPSEPVSSTEDDVLDLSESTRIDTEAPVSASTITKELLEPEQSYVPEPAAEPFPTAQISTPESVEEAAVHLIPTEPNAGAEDAPMEPTEVPQDFAAVPVTELPVLGVALEPETAAEDVLVELADDTNGASMKPLVTQDVPVELSAAAQVTSTGLVTEFSAKTDHSEPVTSSEDVLDLSESTFVSGEEAVVQQVPTEPDASAEDLPMELTEVPQASSEVPVAELPEEAAEDLSMELAAEGKADSTEPVREMATQHAPAEPVTPAQEVPMELSAAAQVNATEPLDSAKPFASTEDVALDLSEAVQVRTEVSRAASSFIKKPDDVPAAQVEPQNQGSLQDVSMEPEAFQCVTAECVDVTPQPHVTMELAEAQGVTLEPGTSPQGACTVTTAVEQGVVSEAARVPTKNASETQREPQTNVHNVATEPRVAFPDIFPKPADESSTDVQSVTTEPIERSLGRPTEPAVASCTVIEAIATVPDVPAEPVEEPRTDMKNVTTEPAVGSLCNPTEPVIAACRVIEAIATVPDVPAEPVEEPRTDVQNMTTEPIVGSLGSPTEPVIAACSVQEPIAAVLPFSPKHVEESRVDVQNVTTEPREGPLGSPTEHVESTAAQPDMFMEPTGSAHCVTMEPVSTKPTEAAPDFPTEPATAVQSVTMEPTAAVQGVGMESILVVVGGKAEEGVAIEAAAEAQNVATEPIVMIQGVSSDPTVVTPGVRMHPSGTSKDVTMEPLEKGQDVVMEPVSQETQDIAEEPMAVVEDVQDVPMEAVTEEQDAAVEPIADAKQTTESQDGSQVFPAVPNDTEELDQANPVHQDGLYRCPIVGTQPGASQTTMATLPGIDHASASSQRASERDQEPRSPVQDRIDPSCAASQEFAQAAGQENLDQPMEVSHDGTVPPRVLFVSEGCVQGTYIKEYANSKFFSVVFGQQVEIKGCPYIPVGVRYLDQRTLYEDVLALVFLDKDVNVFMEALTTALTERCGLNIASCRGLSVLTVGVAGAQVRAVAALLSQRFPRAVCTLSSSVSLNTWLARSSSVTEVAESSMWVEKLLKWMTEDAGKLAMLQRVVKSLFEQDETKCNELTENLTRSQWDRNHDVLDLTVEILEAILVCLNEVKENDGNQTDQAQAAQFLSVFQNFEFILTAIIMKHILSLTKSISQSLQGGPLDVCQAVSGLPGLLSALNDLTLNADCHFQAWFQDAVVLASRLKIGVPHTSGEPVIAHYRDVSRGAVEHSISEITQLFSSDVLSTLRCMQVVPYVISRMEGCMDVELFKVFQEDLPNWDSLQVELQTWRKKCLESMAAQQPHPSCVLDTFRTSDTKSFPNVETILQLLVVLPCCGGEGSGRPGKKSLREFMEQLQTSLPVLYPS